MKKFILLSSLLILAAFTHAKEISIDDFIKTAAKSDTAFEEILIQNLTLKYYKDTVLPAGDILLGVKADHTVTASADTTDTELSLSKLFPYTGTELDVGYTASDPDTELSVYISQPLAENAFGKVTRLRDKIAGIEIDVARFQVTEAYEDYLATIMVAYYDWYSAYENLKIGQSSYQQSVTLLDNMKKRRQNNIALPIDVNKIQVQVLSRKENLIRLRERYKNIENTIRKILNLTDDEHITPQEPDNYKDMTISFTDDYKAFTQTSRTYRMLNLLENKSSLQVARESNELLPSTDLYLGMTSADDSTTVDTTVYGGISLSLPLANTVDRAQYETAKISQKQTKLAAINTYRRLKTTLKNLHLQIQREADLIATVDEKISLAESILKDETENYTYGKASLNDFIRAVNDVDENRFSRIQHSIQLKVLLTEWLRLTDRLVNEKDLQ